MKYYKYKQIIGVYIICVTSDTLSGLFSFFLFQDGGTALVVASQCGHLDIVNELLKRGADPHSVMRDRATAVFVAAQNGHGSVLR